MNYFENLERSVICIDLECSVNYFKNFRMKYNLLKITYNESSFIK
jgi:hypothetical protein